MKSRLAVASTVGLLSLAAAFPARSQTPPIPYNAGTAVREGDQTRQTPLPSNPSVPVLPRVTEPQFTLQDKQTLLVRHIVVDGPMLVDETALRAILSPYEGRDLTLSDIHAAADKVSTLYRDAGYLVATAYVPAQDARDGTLHFKVIPGKYGNITINNHSLVDTDFLNGVLQNATAAGSYVRDDSLERAMLLASDLPGSAMPRVVMGAGKQPETSDFVYDVPEGRRADGYLLADNYGSPFTGRARLNGGANLNSPWGFGDRLSMFGLISGQTGLWNGRLAYAFPLGYSGLHGEVAAYRTSYVLGGIYQPLHATGIADALAGTLTYPVIRQRAMSIYVSGNYTHRILDDKVLGSSTNDRTLDVATAAVTGNTASVVMGFPLTTDSSFSLTQGYVDFANATQKAINLAGPNTAGYYAKLNLSLDATMQLIDRLSIEANLRGQKSATGNLDSSEQLGLTGYYGIRSFDEGLSGDTGFIATPQIKYALPDFFTAYRHSIALFTDVGGVWLENPNFTTTQRSYTQLSDFGIGYAGTYEYSQNRFMLLKAELAHSYSSVDGAQSYNRGTKALIQIGSTF